MWQQLFLVTCLLLNATSLQITGFGNTAVEYGEDAYYTCELHKEKENLQTSVHQVTWQKRLRNHSIENIASYSKPFGPHINEPYLGKVTLGEASLSSASLTINNVTWADECCYICIFNVYREDSKRKQTCLTVQGISEVKAEVRPPDEGLVDGSATAVFSCSATGKPAPIIRWRFSPNDTAFQQKMTMTVANHDGTFTRSQDVTLHLSGSWNGHADCVVQSGSLGEKMARVPFSWDAGMERMVEDEGNGGGLPQTGPTLLVACTFAGAIVMAMIIISIVRAWKKHDIIRHII
ncbi:OX-2 membrane glycoprotein-like isoform X2 [Festucalex cinctus]